MIMKKKFFGVILFMGMCSAALCGCEKELKLSDYLSENRLYYYCAQTDGGELSLKAYYTLREYPYAADGYARDTSGIIEVSVTLSEYSKSVSVSFEADENTYGGDMSYDSVKNVYTYSVSADNLSGENITFCVTAGDNEYSLSAANKNSGYMSAEEILSAVQSEKADYISSMTENNKLCGEIYLRFIWDDDKAYYYVGITDRDKNTLSLLLNAASGEIIAERKS